MVAGSREPSRRRRHRSPIARAARSRLRLFASLAMVAGLGSSVAATFLAIDTAVDVRDLQRGVTRLQAAVTMLGDPLDAANGGRIIVAAAMQRTAASDIVSATARLRANLAVRASTTIPGVAAQSVAAVDMGESASDAAAAVHDLIEVAERCVQSLGGTGPPGARVLQLVVAVQPILGDARHHLDLALSRLRRDHDRPLLPPLEREMRATIARLGRARDTAAGAAGAAGYLPGLLGWESPRTYLLLFPNPLELRPAGGLVGSLGRVTVNRGTPGAISVVGYESLDGRYRSRFPVPAALARRMSFARGSLDIGNAGWDPDFPTTAALSEQMYRSATGVVVDGTIAIDPYAISALLGVVGPIDVPPYGVFTDADFLPKLNGIVNVQTGPASGKQALDPIAHVLLDRLLAAPPSAWPRMLAALGRQAAGGHVLLHLHDPAAAAGAAHLDGSLVSPPLGEDYQMVVDANVGGTKGDAIVRRSVREKVEIGDDGVARHELVARYEYPAGQVDPTVPRGADPAYRDYVRFYLPEFSTVSGLVLVQDGQASAGGVEDLTIEHGKRVVGTFVRVPPGRTAELRLRFQTPLAAGRAYRLYVQKQAGVLSRPVDLVVSHPGGIERRELDGTRDAEVTMRW